MASLHRPTRPRHAAALLLAVVLFPMSLNAQVARPAPQGRTYPDVRSQLIRDAVARLGAAGYRRVRVARQPMNNTPIGTVLWQYPIPTPRLTAPGASPVPDSMEIVLIAVEPARRTTPVVDTLFIRQVDTVSVPRFITRVDTVTIPRIIRRLDTVMFRQVDTVSVPRFVTRVDTVTIPRIIRRLDTVTLRQVDTVSITGVEQRVDTIYQVDTVFIARVDTLFQVDTVTVYREREVSTALLIALAAGGLGLGGLGGYTLSRLKPPPGSVPPKEPARAEKPPADDPAFDPAAPAPMLVDEIITVTSGKAVPHTGRAGAKEAPV